MPKPRPMPKSRLEGMSEEELDEIAFDLDECARTEGRDLPLIRWQNRFMIKVREIHKAMGLDTRRAKCSPAMVYMRFAQERLAAADQADEGELPFRLFERYGERFKAPEQAEPKPEEPPKAEPPTPTEPPPAPDDTAPLPAITQVPDVPKVSKVPEPPAQPPEPPPAAAVAEEVAVESVAEDEPAALEVDWNAF